MTDERAGWVAYNPRDTVTPEHLTPEQHDRWLQHQAGPQIVGEVHLQFEGLAPGQAVISFNAPVDTAPADFLRAAIRELERAVQIHSD